MPGILKTVSALIASLLVLLVLSGCTGFFAASGPENKPLSSAARTRLAEIGSSPSAAMMIRIFKQSSELEVWKRTVNGRFALFKTYEICAWSGALGPKFQEGDRQAPEGFYTIVPGLMNPNSAYHLAFNTGFPNKFDRANGRTGAALMVHGDCRSAGCYAMTDGQIEEIYALARDSFAGGNRSFEMQIFPFRMTEENLTAASSSPHIAFWRNLQQGYDLFEETGQPPSWDVCDRHYVFNQTTGAPLDATGACPVGTPDARLANL
jgi:murein L,D-transpeptidase YafK